MLRLSHSAAKKFLAMVVLFVAIGSISYYYVFVQSRRPVVEQKRPDAPEKAAIPPATETATALPVWWSPKLGLASLDDIPQRLDEKEPPPAQEISFSKGAEQVSISTCSQYLAAKDDGFYAATNFDEGMQSFFMGTCFALRSLKKVKPANTSYLDPNGWSASDLSMLPPIVAELWPDEPGKRAHDASSAGQSWAAFDPSLKIDAIKGYMLTAESSALEGAYSFELLARGDFNGDGVEDWAVVGTTNPTTGGTFHASAFYILTRMTPDAVVSILANP
jgi:hypothetical protein